MEPARAIVRLLGGPTKIAELLGLSVSAVTKWYKPRERGGCGGLIPSQHIATLCRHARKIAVFLEPNMFFQGHV